MPSKTNGDGGYGKQRKVQFRIWTGQDASIPGIQAQSGYDRGAHVGQLFARADPDPEQDAAELYREHTCE
jgi:hypothetical protein